MRLNLDRSADLALIPMPPAIQGASVNMLGGNLPVCFKALE
jgi:hypothetical protein